MENSESCVSSSEMERGTSISARSTYAITNSDISAVSKVGRGTSFIDCPFWNLGVTPKLF